MTQTFTFGGYTWDIDAAEKVASRGEKTRVPVAAMAPMLSMIRVNREYALAHPSPEAPIILAALPEDDGVFHLPIDGWHRIALWSHRGAESVSAFALSPQQSYDLLLRGEEQYRRKAKKAGVPLTRSSRRRM